MWWLPDPKDVGTVDGAGEAQLSADVDALLRRAEQHAKWAGRDAVTGADVLAEMFTEPTARFLLEQGMTRSDATMYLVSHGTANTTGSGQSAGARSPGAQAREAPAQGDTFRVLLLNDDVTPMEFVVQLLEQMFDKDRETAIQIMLHTHHHGMGECGTYPFTVADAKAKALEAFARGHGHPLRCVVEPAG